MPGNQFALEIGSVALFQVTKGVERKNELIYSASEIQNRRVQQDKSLEIQAVLLKVILEIPVFMPLLVINQTWENLLRVFGTLERSSDWADKNFPRGPTAWRQFYGN